MLNMLDFRGLDERQYRRKLRAGNESYVLLLLLMMVLLILQQLPIAFFKGLPFGAAVLYLSMFYYWTRCACWDCAAPDRRRRRTRWMGTVSAAFITVCLIPSLMLTEGNPFMDAQGQASYFCMFSIFAAGQWILTLIYWVQKFQGYEK